MHLSSLQLAIERFLLPYSDCISVYFDSEAGQFVWVFDGEVGEIPSEISLMLGDCLYNLRSSLDHLVWQLVLANGETPSFKNAFIIGRTKRAFDSNKASRLKGISAKALARIEALKPYDGGARMLFELERAANIDKHRHLHILVASVQRGGIWEGAFRYAFKFGPLEKGTELLRCEEGPTNINPHFSFDLAFSQGEVAFGTAVQATVSALLSLVSQTIESFTDCFTASVDTGMR